MRCGSQGHGKWCGNRPNLERRKINTQRDVALVLQNGRGDWLGHEGGRSRCGPSLCCLILERSNVRSIDNQGAFGVIRGHWAIVDHIVSENDLELSFVGATNFAIQCTGGVCGKYFATGEQFLVFGYGGHHGVRYNMVNSIILLNS